MIAVDAAVVERRVSPLGVRHAFVRSTASDTA
jgi:hypothetical protein